MHSLKILDYALRGRAAGARLEKCGGTTGGISKTAKATGARLEKCGGTTGGISKTVKAEAATAQAVIKAAKLTFMVDSKLNC
jgi:hypothetical protein